MHPTAMGMGNGEVGTFRAHSHASFWQVDEIQHMFQTVVSVFSWWIYVVVPAGASHRRIYIIDHGVSHEGA